MRRFLFSAAAVVALAFLAAAPAQAQTVVIGGSYAPAYSYAVPAYGVYPSYGYYAPAYAAPPPVYYSAPYYSAPYYAPSVSFSVGFGSGYYGRGDGYRSGYYGGRGYYGGGGRYRR